MDAKILNKLTPAGRKQVIEMEARMRILDEEIAYIDQMEAALDGKLKKGFLGDD